MQKPTIFFSSSSEGLPIAHELARQLESSSAPTVWPESAFYPGKTVLGSLTEAVDRSDFAVVVFTEDDAPSRKAKGESKPSNLVFELGFLAGRLGLERTFIVVADANASQIPSDLAGVNLIRVPRVMGEGSAGALAPAVAAIARVIDSIGARESQATDRFFSCFISYAWKDKEFAARLHDDLLEVGVRSWLDVKELRLGDKLSEQIQRGIQTSDKVLLVLSEASVLSPWVAYEVRNTFAREKARGQSVLFPIRLDDAVFSTAATGELIQLREKFIADFSRWRDRSEYRRAFSRLVRDLAITASAESGRAE